MSQQLVSCDRVDKTHPADLFTFSPLHKSRIGIWQSGDYNVQASLDRLDLRYMFPRYTDLQSLVRYQYMYASRGKVPGS